MTIKEILFLVPTYPDAPPERTLESVGFLGQHLGARITASVSPLNSDTVTWPFVFGSWPVDVRRLMDETVHLSERNAKQLGETLTKLGSAYRVDMEVRKDPTTLYSSPRPLIDLARLHDLTVMPVPEIDSFDRNYIESAIFDTGRPTLLLPSGKGSKSLQRLDTVVVAWDFSRAAARALSDAFPILTKATRVHILSVFGEKGIQTSSATADLERYLAAHEIKYELDKAVLKEGTISELMAQHAAKVHADMLVMGAYGHSQLREFVLGGATRGILSSPPLPVFLSH